MRRHNIHFLLPLAIYFLDSADRSLYGSVHEVDMVIVAEKLAEPAAGGVDVLLVIESKWWEGPKNGAAKQVLEKSRSSSPSSGRPGRGGRQL